MIEELKFLDKFTKKIFWGGVGGVGRGVGSGWGGGRVGGCQGGFE